MPHYMLVANENISLDFNCKLVLRDSFGMQASKGELSKCRT